MKRNETNNKRKLTQTREQEEETPRKQKWRRKTKNIRNGKEKGQPTRVSP